MVTSNEIKILVLIVLLLVGVGFYYFKFSTRAIFKNIFDKYPLKRIGEVKDGDLVVLRAPIKFYGRTCQAVFSGRNCVYYSAKATRYYSSKSKHYDVADEQKWADVVLEQDGVLAKIDTRNAKANVVMDKTSYNGLHWESNKRVLKFLERHELPLPKTLFNFPFSGNSIELEEGVLEEDEYVTVSGKGRWVDSKELKLKVTPQKVLLIEAVSDSEKVYLSDDPSLTWNQWPS